MRIEGVNLKRILHSVQNIEPSFFVRIPIGIIRPNLVAWQMLLVLGSAVEAVGKTVAGGLPRGGVATPAGGVVPLAIGAGRIDMDGNEDHMVFAQAAAPGIDTSDTLGERVSSKKQPK